MAERTENGTKNKVLYDMVRRSCPARNPFTAQNSQGLLNSTLKIRKDSSILLGLRVHRSDQIGPPVRPVWPLPDRLQDAPPVRPLRDTGLTGGVSLIGLVPNLGANICPPVF
jgi:hypothetical protein